MTGGLSHVGPASQIARAYTQTPLTSPFSSNRSFSGMNLGAGGLNNFYPSGVIQAANKLNDRLSNTISDFRKVSPEMDLGDELKIMQDLDKLIPDLKKQSEDEKKAFLEKIKTELGNSSLTYDDIDKAIEEKKKSATTDAENKKLDALKAEKEKINERAERLVDLEKQFKDVRKDFVDPKTIDKDRNPTGDLYKDATELNRLEQKERQRIHNEFKQKLADPLNGLENNFKILTIEEEDKLLKERGLTRKTVPTAPLQQPPSFGSVTPPSSKVTANIIEFKAPRFLPPDDAVTFGTV